MRAGLVVTACGQRNRGIAWQASCLSLIPFGTLVAVLSAGAVLQKGRARRLNLSVITLMAVMKKEDMMVPRKAIATAALLITILLLPLLILVAQQTTPLLIEGPQGQAKVIQVQGKSYVEIDELARITGATLRFAGNKIILTLPVDGDTLSQTEQSAPAPRPTAGLSRPFLSAGIETMREILEWHAALKTGIERGYPLSDVWFGNFRRQIEASLKQAEAAASTDVDQKALPLLNSEFHTMSALTDKYLKIATTRDYLAPDSLNSDPLDQKVLTCWQSLASIASSNQFVDDGSCQ